MSDHWYSWADDLIEDGRQQRSYELGALRGHMKVDPLDSGSPRYGYRPYTADVPGVGKIQMEILPGDGSGQPLDWNEVKAANPWYFEALKQAAAIMPSRRAKYSGEDPFDNFERVGRITGTSAAEAFRFDIALKLARLQVGAGDFEDESFNDCLRDLANYALLWYGYRLKAAERQTSP